MKIITMPPQSAEFLNTVLRKIRGIDCDLPGALESYASFCRASASWLEQRKKLCITEEEETIISNIQFLLQKRDELFSELGEKEPDAAFLDSLGKLEFEIADALTGLNGRDERSRVSPVAAVNDFLLSAWVHLNRQGDVEHVRTYFGFIKENIAFLKDDFTANFHRLKEEARREIEKGFVIMEEGARMVEEYLGGGDSSLLDMGCSNVKEGGRLINYYVEWRNSAGERLAAQYNRFSIPFIGADLQILLDEGKENHDNDWAEKVEAVESVSLPRLTTFWNDTESALFVKPSAKAQLAPAINEQLERLGSVMADLKNFSEEGLRSYEEILVSLSSLFSELDRETLRWGHALGTQGEMLGEAVKGLYYGTLPDFVADDLVRHFRSSPMASYQEETITALEAYLESGNREQLLWALEKFLELLPDDTGKDQGGGLTIPCTFCGTPNEPTRTSCSSCHARLVFRETLLLDDQETVKEKPFELFELPLPAAAGPLVQLLHAAEKGECSQEYAAALLEAFSRKVEEAETGTRTDKSLPEATKKEMSAIVEVLKEGDAEARKFLATSDISALQSALRIVSEGSLRVRELKNPD